MQSGYWKILGAILLMTFSAAKTAAQNNVVGTTWSLSGIGLVYERHIDEATFATVGLQTEMKDAVFGINPDLGFSASFTWNLVFATVNSRNDLEVKFYAGPGAAVGYGSDGRTNRDIFFGLKGRVGARCSFDRNIDLAVGVAPVLGLHRYVGQNKNAILKCYNNGILQTLMPEIVIAYRF